MSKKLLVCFVTFFMIFWMQSSAAHSQAHQSWLLREMVYTTSGLGVKYKYRDRPTTIEILYSKSQAEAGDVAFICSNEQLTLRVTTVLGDVYKIIGDNISNAYEFNGNKRRTFRPKMWVSEKRAKKVKWIEGREERVIMPTEYKAVADIYNAVVTGKQVRLKRKKEYDLILNLPEVNDNFLAFGAECRIGNKK